MKKKRSKSRDKRDRRSRREDGLPNWLVGSVVSSEKRGGAGRRKRDS